MGSTLNPNQTLLQSKNLSASNPTPAPLANPSSRVAFKFLDIFPPSILYVDVDDNFIISGASSQGNEIVTVNVRLLLPDNRIEDMQFQLVFSAAYTITKLTSRLAQGFILSVSASALQAVTRGQTFVRLSIQRSASGAGQPAQMLFADYVTTQSTSAYPNGRVQSPTEGPGFIRVVNVINPPAGTDWFIQPTNNTRWKIRGWNAVLTTAVAVANRQPQVFLTTGGGGLWWKAGILLSIPASTVANICAANLSPYTSVIATDFILPLPQEVFLANNTIATMQIGVQTVGIQGADQWSGIQLGVEEWLDNV